MNEFRADLHCHSTCSDGTLTPEELIRKAKEIGLSALSITDHDTIEGYQAAPLIAKEMGIDLIPGVEFSTKFEQTSIHILAYGFDLESPAIHSFCKRHLERRYLRNLEILTLLKKHGMPLTEEELAPREKQGTIGRPHIAHAMMQRGYVTTIEEAFHKFIGDNKPCFSMGPVFTVAETIDLIHEANGLAVIAHPHLIQDKKIVNKLLQFNFDGIECYYAYFPKEKILPWLKIAKEKKWLITGGSDFHGTVKPKSSLGSSYIGEDLYTQIKQASYA
ncbi:MAG: PHP domain-containing protein [Waddliaceae bacterium]